MDTNVIPSAPSTTDESRPARPPTDEQLADEIGAASFPASDPPATWTWDPR